MHIAIIIGSQRSDSQSSKVGAYLTKQLQMLGAQVTALDLGKNHLPYYDEDKNPSTDTGKQIRKPYADILNTCDGLVVISPERSGMVPAVLKNFFLWCKNGEIAHKPGLIVTVSSSMGGSYPVAELRMSSYKNTKIAYIPDHVIVRDVNNVLNGDDSEGSQRIEKKIDYTLRILIEYCKGFDIIRKSSIIKDESIPNGM